MNFRYTLILIIGSFAITSCWINDPKKLASNGIDEFQGHKADLEYLSETLDDILRVNNNCDSRLYIQSKQNHVDYSEKDDGMYEIKKSPVVISNEFIKTANEFGVDDIWLSSDYYKFRKTENSSTEYHTYFVYLKNEKQNIFNFEYQDKLSNNWIIGIVRKELQ